MTGSGRDGGYCGLFHRTADFAAAAGIDCPRNVAVEGRADPGSAYAPPVIERYTTGTRDRVRLYFTMSTWHSYNVLLMTTEFERKECSVRQFRSGVGAGSAGGPLPRPLARRRKVPRRPAHQGPAQE